MTTDKAIEILSKRNYLCGECPFSGPDCQGCRLAEALDLAINALKASTANDIYYLCDHKRCGENFNCYECNHTSDIKHAVNFDLVEFPRSVFYEIDRPHGEWVAVKDKLPDTDGEYLVSLDNGRIVVADDLSIIENHDFEPKMVAWQPLPEPYCGADMRGDDK